MRAPDLRLRYADAIEMALTEIVPVLPTAPIAPRALGLLWLSGAPVVIKWLRTRLEWCSGSAA